MPIIQCPQCSADLEIDAESAGESVQCGSCNHIFTAQFGKKTSSKRVADDDAPFKKPSRRANRDDDEDEVRPSKRRRESDEDDDYDRSPRRRTPQGGKGMGIASMVCGIIGLVGSCCCIIFPVVGIVGIVLGFLSLKTPGKGFGIAGIICGGLSIIMIVISLIFSVGLNMANIGAGGAGGNPPVFRGR